LDERAVRRIYVDVDDVLAQTGRMFLDLLTRAFGRRVAFEQIHSYHLGDSFGLAEDELGRFMHMAHRPEVLESIAPMPGAAAALVQWRRRGYEIVVVTGRPPETREATVAWLERHAMPFDEFHLLDKYSEVYRDRDGVPDDVLSLADLPGLGLSLAVEDFPGAAEHLAHEVGVPVALFDRPWNRRMAPVDGGAPLVRCSSWDEIRRRFPAP
jgi:uncharacterized HAD superfamily protein